MDIQRLSSRIEAAQGKAPCDLVIQNANYLDVFSGRWQTGDVAIFDGVIVGLDPGLKARRVIDGKRRWIVPGWIDAHVHIESSLLVPSHFQSAVLGRGTTSVV